MHLFYCTVAKAVICDFKYFGSKLLASYEEFYWLARRTSEARNKLARGDFSLPRASEKALVSNLLYS